MNFYIEMLNVGIGGHLLHLQPADEEDQVRYFTPFSFRLGVRGIVIFKIKLSAVFAREWLPKYKRSWGYIQILRRKYWIRKSPAELEKEATE